MISNSNFTGQYIVEIIFEILSQKESFYGVYIVGGNSVNQSP